LNKMENTGSQGPGDWLSSPTVKTRILSLSRTQSRAVIGLLTGHNTLRRYLHFMQLIYSSLCRKCEAKEENSSHVLRDCDALPSHRHAYSSSFFLDPEDVKESQSGGQLELQ
jgi:hypothetical protein